MSFIYSRYIHNQTGLILGKSEREIYKVANAFKHAMTYPTMWEWSHLMLNGRASMDIIRVNWHPTHAGHDSQITLTPEYGESLK